MIKRIIFIMMLVTLSFSLQAKVVTKDKALETAARFFDLTSTRAGYPQLTLVWDGEEVLTRTATDPAFFVFNNCEGGYVIISGDDAAMPVLGYSRSGSFDTDNMPDNMKGWMMGYRDQILSLRSNNVGSSDEVSQKWLEVGLKTRSGASTEKILNTALWAQGKPFYNDCPLERGSRCLTGCGPTAMSIIMYYLRVPYGQFLDEDGVTVLDGFDWDNMLLSYNSEYTTAQAAAVARLMAENGSRAQATYGTSGTSVLPSDVLTAYKGYKYADGTYVFDQNISMSLASSFTTDEWMQKIYDDIDNDRPISYYGWSNNSGHAFVLDGYGADSYFHFNWGWSGSYNGMFLLTVMGNSSMGYYFKDSQRAIFGLKSNVSGNTYYLSITGTGAPTIEEGSINSDGEPFKIKFSGITNTGSSTYSGTLKLALADVDGNIKAYCAESSIDGLAVGESTSVTFTSSNTTAFEFGDKFIICYSKMGFLPAIHAGSSTAMESLPVYQVSIIDVESEGYSSGDTFSFALSNSNETYSSIEWTFDGSVITEGSVTLTAGSHTVKCKITYPDGTVEKIKQVIRVE